MESIYVLENFQSDGQHVRMLEGRNIIVGNKAYHVNLVLYMLNGYNRLVVTPISPWDSWT